MVIKGELDLSNNFVPGVAELANKGCVRTHFAEAPYMLSANAAVPFLNTTKKPMDDPGFRKALAFAFDVPSIVKSPALNSSRLPVRPASCRPSTSTWTRMQWRN